MAGFQSPWPWGQHPYNSQMSVTFPDVTGPWGALPPETLLGFLRDSVLIPREEISRVLQQVVVPEVERILQGVSGADPRFGSAFQRSGSYIEGLKVSEPDEFDFLVPLPKFPKLYLSDKVVSVPQPEAPQDLSFVPVILSDTGPKGSKEPGEDMSPWQQPDVSKPVGESILPGHSYTDMCPLRNLYTPAGQAHCPSTCVIPAQVMSLFKKRVCDVISRKPGRVKVQRMQQDTPAVTLTIPWRNMEISVDLVPFIKDPFNEWILDWPRPGMCWPMASKIAEIKDAGVDLVAKHHLYWRYSFSRIERVLLEKIDTDGGQRRNSLRILKKVREDRWKPKFGKKALVSYYLKTVLFWACEDYPENDQWQDLDVSFKRLVDKLIYFLCLRKLPHYFLGSSVNLFTVEDKVLDDIRRVVVQFKVSPMAYFQ